MATLKAKKVPLKITVLNDDNNSFNPKPQRDGKDIIHIVFVTLTTPQRTIDRLVSFNKAAKKTYVYLEQIPRLHKEVAPMSLLQLDDIIPSNDKVVQIINIIADKVSKEYTEKGYLQRYGVPRNKLRMGMGIDGRENISGSTEMLIQSSGLGFIPFGTSNVESMTIVGFWNNLIYAMSTIDSSNVLSVVNFLKNPYFDNFLASLLMIMEANGLPVSMGKKRLTNYYWTPVSQDFAAYDILEQLPDKIRIRISKDRAHIFSLKQTNKKGLLFVRPAVLVASSILKELFNYVGSDRGMTDKELLNMLYTDISTLVPFAKADKSQQWTLYLPSRLYADIDLYNDKKGRNFLTRQGHLMGKTGQVVWGIQFVSILFAKIVRNIKRLDQNRKRLERDIALFITVISSSLSKKRGKSALVTDYKKVKMLVNCIVNNQFTNIYTEDTKMLYARAIDGNNDMMRKLVKSMSLPYLTRGVQDILRNDYEYNYTDIDTLFNDMSIINAAKLKKPIRHWDGTFTASTFDYLMAIFAPVREGFQVILENVKPLQYHNTFTMRQDVSEML